MKRIEDIKEFEDIDTYYEISEIVDEVFQDRVEAHKHLVTANKEIIILNNRINAIETQLQQKENIIKEVREYIENNDLYEQDYDYDYEENLVEYPPSDKQARKDILEILEKEVN